MSQFLAALSLFRKSVTMCMEPIWCLDGNKVLVMLSDAGVAIGIASEVHISLTSLCAERLQHLISRVEQVTQRTVVAF